MPGGDVNKANYPPCNRAFALRMMNPTSYVDDHVSPLDKQLQPFHKKFIAKSGDEQQHRSTDYISVDEFSLSPASSTTSLSEMELYDIDENHYMSDQQQSHFNGYPSHNMRQHVLKSSSSSNEGDPGMVRSYSYVDGFDRYFNRQSVARSSMPSRAKSKSNAKDILREGYHVESSPKGARASNTLRRTQSLKGNRPNVPDQGNSTRGRSKTSHVSEAQKSPSTKIRVVGTKSSQLRAQVTEVKQKQKQQVKDDEKLPRNVPSPKKGRTPSASSVSRKPRSLNSTEEYISESDSNSTAFSEMEAYNPRYNPRGCRPTKVNGYHPSPQKQVSHRPVHRSPSLSPKLNSKSHATSLKMALPKTDTFGNKLSEICRLISERHPGDFQILETLTEMQVAYEERNELVKDTISNLREKVKTLEHKCAHSPNIPGLVIPLMRATSAFQTQLQSIMDAYHIPGKDQSIQFPETEPALNNISIEANLVANEIEKVGLGTPPGVINSPKQDSPTKGVDNSLETSSSSDKENICNGEHSPSSLESYTIISEAQLV